MRHNGNVAVGIITSVVHDCRINNTSESRLDDFRFPTNFVVNELPAGKQPGKLHIWGSENQPVHTFDKIEDFMKYYTDECQYEELLQQGNKTRSDLSVKRLMPSCGCTPLVAKERQPIEVPFVLSSSESLPILVVVNTKGIISGRNETILIQYEYKGRPFIAIGTVVFDVSPALNLENQECEWTQKG